MKPELSYPMHRAKRSLAVCSAALFTLTATAVWAADPAPTKADVSAAMDDEVQTLSPFEVTSSKDTGYLKTNAATATKIGMEIQKLPLNVSVISREFLDDTNAKSLTDLFRYSSASAGDNRFAMRVPANEATPQGGFTMRGFQVNNMMRDGIFRYTAYNLDSVERVEIVKGPASVFFGQGYPGGVINYISKRATFAKVPTTFSYTIDDNGGDKFKFDHNAVLDKHTAFRVSGAWVDTVGDRRYEFRKGFNVTPSVTINPFESGKLVVKLDFEYLKERFNVNDYDWIFSDYTGWKDAARTGAYGSSTATFFSQINASVGNNQLAAYNNSSYPTFVGSAGNIGQNGIYRETVASGEGFVATGNIVHATNTPTLAYATYINNKRLVGYTVTGAVNGIGGTASGGNIMLPAYTTLTRGAFITNKAGKLVKDESFNYTSRGSWSDNEVKVMTAAVEFQPFEWLSGRAAWVRDVSNFNNFGNSAVTTPYADLVHWNVGLSAGGSGYYRETKTALVDLIFSKEFFHIKNKLLVGAQKADWRQLYMGKAASGDVNLAFLPGATNTTANPDYVSTNAVKYAFGGVPVNQIIRDRAGAIKPVRQIYSNWDPGAEIEPDISVYWQDDRNALDGYRPTLSSFYANYQGSLLDDRLTVLAGYREEKRYERWQDQSNNFPWYIYPNDMPQNPNAYPEDVWGNSKAYQQTIPLDQRGRSSMMGASFAITKSINIYTSYSKTFKFNSGNVGGFFPGPGISDELSVYQSALDWGYRGPGVSRIPGGFILYDNSGTATNSTLITSIAQAKAVMVAKGAYDNIKNETGKNIEFGGKISTPDQKIVGTVSIFRGERSNQKLDDGPKQANTAEPFNASTVLFGPGTRGYNSGNFRWRSTDLTNRVEGMEAEVIWTPIRNFQAVINASDLWTAKTLIDKTRPKPGDPRYDNLPVGGTGRRDIDIYYAARLENVPKYRFNFFGKYTITDGLARGGSVGLGMRYSSKAVVSRSVDWNPLAGGFQSGDYVVFDLTFGYPWEVLGYKVTSSLGIYNVTDKFYVEGATFVASPPRNWVFTNTLKF